jgi:hypothetical protein
VTIASFQQVAAMENPNADLGGRGRWRARRGAQRSNLQVPKLQQPPGCPSAPSIMAGVVMTNAIFQGENLSASQVFYATGAATKQDSFELTPAKS